MLHLQVFNLLPCKPSPVAFEQNNQKFYTSSNDSIEAES